MPPFLLSAYQKNMKKSKEVCTTLLIIAMVLHIVDFNNMKMPDYVLVILLMLYMAADIVVQIKKGRGK